MAIGAPRAAVTRAAPSVGAWHVCHLGSILFGDTMVPIIEYDSILLLGYSILYKEYYLTRFNHQKNCSLGLDLAKALRERGDMGVSQDFGYFVGGP